MSYFEHAGTTYEFTTTSEVGSDDWIVECTELSNPQGYFGAIVVSPDLAKATLRTEAGVIPLAALHHWLSLLPEPLEVTESDE